jgi:hypothetical protein
VLPNKHISNEVILIMVNKTMEWHVFLAFVKTIMITTIFDIWMSEGGFDIFFLVVNYINKQLEPCHFILSIYEVHKTLGIAMVMGQSTIGVPKKTISFFIQWTPSLKTLRCNLMAHSY